MCTPSPRHQLFLCCGVLILLLVLMLTGCGGSSGIGVADNMPTRASDKAMSKARACDNGKARACNWIGIWFMVGGAGSERKAEGRRFLHHACNKGYQPSCKLARALNRHHKSTAKPSRVTSRSRQPHIGARKVYNIVQKSVYTVRVSGNSTGVVVRGSAVAVAPGWLVTNCHVVKTVGRIVVSRGTWETTAHRGPSTLSKDVCLLRSSATLPGLPAQLGSTHALSVGDDVFAVGTPRGLELSITKGIISQLHGDRSHPLIQTSAAISPGSSGGGLFDARAQLVGITSFSRKNSQNLNFAQPVEHVKDLLARIQGTR